MGEFLREHQLNIMLMLSSICGIMAAFVVFTKALPPRRRISMLLMYISAMLLITADRFAYIYRGDPGSKAYYMVRICNFAVFFLSLFIFYAFNDYLTDLYSTEGGLKVLPKRLTIVKLAVLAGIVLLIVSQFTGLYYTFDENNTYRRSSGFIICYLLPMLIFILQLSVIIQYYKRLPKLLSLSLLLFTALPLTASVVQVFAYGLSLTNMALVGMMVALYVFAQVDLSQKNAQAAKREIELLNEEKKQIRILLGQTAYALASAIDAKDGYTHGHSERVAEYSEMIAIEAGKSPMECKEIYFIALLHDVGKIGVPGSIINKTSRLDDAEYEIIKQHTVRGNQILSSITKYPDLSIGAHYHHERYDGKGYPEGLKGEEIPEIARIIAVADAYDAMTSNRSYRKALPQEVVRQEIEKGIGTQFDPEFGRIMLKLIDSDRDYEMRELEAPE